MGRYTDKLLLSDEKVVYASRLHWVIYAGGLFTICAGVVFAHFGNSVAHQFLPANWAKVIDNSLRNAALGTILIGALQLFRSFIRQISTELIITNRRVISKFGFIAATTYELMMPKVEGANIDQTVAGRILGYGTVLVKGTGGGTSPVDHIAEPARFQKCLLRMIDIVQRPEAYALGQPYTHGLPGRGQNAAPLYGHGQPQNTELPHNAPHQAVQLGGEQPPPALPRSKNP